MRLFPFSHFSVLVGFLWNCSPVVATTLASRFSAMGTAHGANFTKAMAKSFSTNWSTDYPHMCTFLVCSFGVIFILLFLAWALDVKAFQTFHQSLTSNKELKVLASVENVKGNPWVLDKCLDPPGTHGMGRADVLAARERVLHFHGITPPPPTHASSSSSSPPGSPTSPLYHTHVQGREDALLAAVLKNADDPVEVMMGHRALHRGEAVAKMVVAHGGRQGRGVCQRVWVLRTFILRYWGLQVFFTHKFMEPFTVFGPHRSRLGRCALLITLLLLTHWLGGIWYSFKSGTVQSTISEEYSFGELLPITILCAFLNIPSQLIVLAILGRLTAWAEAYDFAIRFPFVAVERERREASDRRLAALSESQLAEELERALAAQKLAVEKMMSEVGEGGVPVIIPKREEEGEGGTAGTAAGDTSGGATNSMAGKGMLVLAPSNDELLETVAASVGLEYSSKARQGKSPKGGISTPNGKGKGEEMKKQGKAMAGQTPSSPPEVGVQAEEKKAAAKARKDAEKQGRKWGLLACLVTRRSATKVSPLDALAREEAEAVEEARVAKLALAAADKAVAAAEAKLKVVEARERMAALNPPRFYALARITATPASWCLFLLYFTLYFLYVWYMLCFAVVQTDAVALAFIQKWLIVQSVQQVGISALVPLLGTLWTFCFYPALSAALEPCLGGGGGKKEGGGGSTYTHLRANGGAAAARARDRLMTQAAAIAGDLPPTFSVIAYGVALAAGATAGAAGHRMVVYAAQAMKDEGEAALDEKVEEAVAEEAEEEAEAAAAEEEEGMEGSGGGGGGGGGGPVHRSTLAHLTPSQRELLTVESNLMSQVEKSVKIAEEAAALEAKEGLQGGDAFLLSPISSPAEKLRRVHMFQESKRMAEVGGGGEGGKAYKPHRIGRKHNVEDEYLRRIRERHEKVAAGIHVPGMEEGEGGVGFKSPPPHPPAERRSSAQRRAQENAKPRPFVRHV